MVKHGKGAMLHGACTVNRIFSVFVQNFERDRRPGMVLTAVKVPCYNEPDRVAEPPYMLLVGR